MKPGNDLLPLARDLIAQGRIAGDTSDCCTISTKGRSGCWPRHMAPSAAAISRMVPPTCTVLASRQRGSLHGTGPSSAQSSLNTPGPKRYLPRRFL